MASVLARQRATSVALEACLAIVCELYTCNLILYLRVLRTDIKIITHQHSLVSKSSQAGCTRTVRGGAIAARFGRFAMLSCASRPAIEAC